MFSTLSPKLRECLESRGVVRHHKRGCSIAFQGDAARTLKVVMRGWVKLYRISRNGEEAILETLSEGYSFDEAAALQGGVSAVSAEALTDCTLLHVDLSAIGSCPDAREEIQSAVLRAASSHLDEMMAQVECLKLQSSTQRLGDYLVALSQTDEGAADVQLPYEKVVLAGKLGMKPESLSRAFSRLKKLGVSSDLRSVRIGDVASLRAFTAAEA